MIHRGELLAKTIAKSQLKKTTLVLGIPLFASYLIQALVGTRL